MIKLNTLLLLVALSVLAVVHLIALEFYLYWYYLWLDIPMHFFGGIIVAIGIFSATELKIPLAAWFTKRWWRAMSIVVFVMVAWEIFEVWAGVPMLEDYVFDTALDMTMGFIGGILGFFLAKRLIMFNR